MQTNFTEAIRRMIPPTHQHWLSQCHEFGEGFVCPTNDSDWGGLFENYSSLVAHEITQISFKDDYFGK